MITQIIKKITPILVLWSIAYSLWSVSLFAQEGNEGKEDELFFIAQQALDDGFYDISADYFKRHINEYPHSEKRNEAELFLGRCYYNKGEYLKALSLFESLLKKKDAENIHDALLFWIGQVQLKGKDFQRARDFYDRVITGFPESQYAPFGYFYKGESYFNQGDYSQAIGVWQRFVKQFPDHKLRMEADFKIGEAMYRLKEYNSCLLHFNAFLKFYPKSHKIIEATLYRAESEFYLERYAEASVDYLYVINNSKPSQLYWQARLGLSWSYLKQKRYREAKASFSTIRKIFVSDDIFIQTQFGMALLFKELRNNHIALSIYNEIIENKPQSSYMIDAYIAKAEILYDIDRLNDAIKTYDEIIKEFSGDSELGKSLDKVYYGLAWAYLRLGDFKKSIEGFQKVAKISDDEVVKISALCQAADTYLDNNELDEAIQIYDSLLRDYPDSFYADYAQYQLGNSLYKKKDFDGALLAFRSVLKNFPDSRLKDETAYAIGLVYFSKGDFLTSLNQCDSFIKDFPEHELAKEALYIKGVCLYNLSRFKDAIEIFSQVQNRFNSDKELVINSEYQIADCFLRLGNEGEALRRFRKFLSSYPDSRLSLQILLWLGEYFLKQNSPDTARRYIRQVVDTFGESEFVAHAYYLFAQSYILEEDFDKALDWFGKAGSIAKDSLKFRVLLGKADTLVMINKFSEALSIYQDISNRSIEFKKAASLKIAEVYIREKQYNNALSLLRSILDLQPQELNPSIQFQIAEVLEEMQDFSKAASEYLKVSYLYPQEKDLVVRSLLRAAGLSERQQQWQDALSFYRKIIAMEAEEAKYAQERIEWIEKNILLTRQ